MIYVNLKGGLGNQMFEYAFAYALAKKTGDDIRLSLKGISNLTHNVYSLDKLNISYNQTVKDVPFSKTDVFFLKSINYILCRLNNQKRFKIEKNFQRCFNKKGFYLCADGFVDTYPSKKNLKYVDGYFQCYKYFNTYREEIKNEFRVKSNPLKRNIKYLEMIDSTNSVCLHIRRGDYTKFSNHLVCTIDYYKQAVSTINRLVNKPEFFIFSDDIEWVKENIDFGVPVNYIEGNNKNYEELRLMYSCKHFIISNSSFSYWAQYLSDNNEKVVVSPNKWFVDQTQQVDIFEPNWIKIDVDI